MQKKECEQYDFSNCQLWGEENFAFVKKDKKAGVWLVCDAMGEKLAEATSRDEAFIVARQSELQPSSVH